MHERTAAQFGETHDESFVYEVEAEKQYVERLKNQREKVTTLSCRFKPFTPSMMYCLRTLRQRKDRLKKKIVSFIPLRNDFQSRIEVQNFSCCYPRVHGFQTAKQGDQDGKSLPTKSYLRTGVIIFLPAWPVQIQVGSHLSKIRGDGALKR